MDAILLAAGNSSRMGAGVDKQLVRLGGKPIMVFSLERLLHHSTIDRVVITTQPANIETIEGILRDYRLDTKCVVVAGGSSRQESVRLALDAVTTDRVVVHEGARPLIDDDLIDRVQGSDAVCVVPTVEVPFTVAVGGDTMTSELDRATLHNVQLPQAFDTAILREAHKSAAEAGQEATEDSALVFRLGHEVVFVEGNPENIKITYQADLAVADSLIFGKGGQ